MVDPDRLILLGEIGSAHGIKGEVSIRTFTEDPADIAAYGPLSDKAGKRTFKIAGLRVSAKAVIARLQGVDDRTAAEKLRNTGLYVKRSQLPELEPGAYYYEDLAGLAAVDPDGSVLGTVVGVVNYGAGDLVEISRPGERETLLVPFTKEAVPAVDIETGRVTVVLPKFADDDGEAGTADGLVEEE
ncbi:MAG: 16S rRNA processing protein RimM [Hyphomicrobium sp.]|jgi:16S rRNA processing protein RimM|nr:16S rRNA processing protein RimM [Hyphomicrobium sp.]PPD07911.1 MAG: 16S rRNA processing protein RimM [Hyphomicrobium sp.]